jgi:hypothetical protein
MNDFVRQDISRACPPDNLKGADDSLSMDMYRLRRIFSPEAFFPSRKPVMTDCADARADCADAMTECAGAPPPSSYICIGNKKGINLQDKIKIELNNKI